MARRFHWTPQQVGEMDPHFLDELIACLNAQEKYDKDLEKKNKRKQRGKS